MADFMGLISVFSGYKQRYEQGQRASASTSCYVRKVTQIGLRM